MIETLKHCYATQKKPKSHIFSHLDRTTFLWESNRIRKEREEEREKTVNSGRYVLPEMPKGRAHTLLTQKSPILKKIYEKKVNLEV